MVRYILRRVGNLRLIYPLSDNLVAVNSRYLDYTEGKSPKLEYKEEGNFVPPLELNQPNYGISDYTGVPYGNFYIFFALAFDVMFMGTDPKTNAKFYRVFHTPSDQYNIQYDHRHMHMSMIILNIMPDIQGFDLMNKPDGFEFDIELPEPRKPSTEPYQPSTMPRDTRILTEEIDVLKQEVTTLKTTVSELQQRLAILEAHFRR